MQAILCSVTVFNRERVKDCGSVWDYKETIMYVKR